jgi:excisionase family DNA binding protein
MQSLPDSRPRVQAYLPPTREGRYSAAVTTEPAATGALPPVQPLVPLLVTPPDAAHLLAVSERTLWGLTDAGEVRAVRIGRAVRYAVSDLVAYVERLQAQHIPAAPTGTPQAIGGVTAGEAT